ncbi:M24 family metallopeptidase [Saliphagus infecundisoli]|uniref:M24 family metallopeptidase n=1 Tax=Saliphagus infecundisoli TaxID=1849069 RepID=A0ABD5QE36_9EURY|nr:Xaa-Pro peptidase family protein [Saliphagus infecundisoli]
MKGRYEERQRRAQQRLKDRGADAAIVYPGPNLQYFTGFRGEPVDRFHALYLPTDGDVTLITPAQYLTQARRNVTADAFCRVDGNDPATVGDAIVSLLPSAPEGLLVDDRTPHALTAHLYDALESGTIGSAAPVCEAMRRRKDDDELAALQRSADIADAVSEEIRLLGASAIGLTEAELATKIRTKLHSYGATAVSFDVVVGAGPNGADPALRHSDREIRTGDPVVIDFGCFREGYASDQTRTVVFDDEPPTTPAEFDSVHEAVHAALEAGIAAVEPGVSAGDVDRAARDTLEEYGYAERFTHGTGHGVGLAAHEDLVIGPGATTTLEEGMVFSVEPGVYFEGEWGVRIEDLVAVTQSGCIRLNDSSRAWKP